MVFSTLRTYVHSLSSSFLPWVQVSRGMNVLGNPLECCCTAPVTGYYRDGYCRTGAGDLGVHVVCAQVKSWRLGGSKVGTESFLVK
jgi:uncharacterized protein (DUF2237 family)